MKTFVKYANRKLHEIGSQTEYVSAATLMELVVRGQDFEVIEDRTGRDLTCLMLARLIYERCKIDLEVYSVADLRRLLTKPKKPETKTAMKMNSKEKAA